ncbi:heavy metal-associated isoprenylated plant protein 16-like [Bidens hawaiensis]|uniref:heavy metal-associated isoprenylated plant protein 16-like n=1 Tax=Bidens hawaiensis TaxID=980011 RepID=UPI00404AF58D
MEKQKIVLKLSTKKTQKAMQVAVSVPGVESAAFVGADKEQIEVKGAGIDSVELTTLLRKKVGYAELVSVGPADEKKDKETKLAEGVIQVDPYQYYYYNYGMPYYYVYKY